MLSLPAGGPLRGGGAGRRGGPRQRRDAAIGRRGHGLLDTHRRGRGAAAARRRRLLLQAESHRGEATLHVDERVAEPHDQRGRAVLLPPPAEEASARMDEKKRPSALSGTVS